MCCSNGAIITNPEDKQYQQAATLPVEPVVVEQSSKKSNNKKSPAKKPKKAPKRSKKKPKLPKFSESELLEIRQKIATLLLNSNNGNYGLCDCAKPGDALIQGFLSILRAILFFFLFKFIGDHCV